MGSLVAPPGASDHSDASAAPIRPMAGEGGGTGTGTGTGMGMDAGADPTPTPARAPAGTGPVGAILPGGRRHFQHGPIDLVIGAEGDPLAVEDAHRAAWQRFRTVLDELVRELRALRLPVRGPCALQGPIARRMWLACRPFHSAYITPMAAVAGSVAQEIIACYRHVGITRAWVNNGGDIALHLTPGTAVDVGLVTDPGRWQQAAIDRLRCAVDPAGPVGSGPGAAPPVDGRFRIDHSMPSRGVATSGWRGRSFSLGIADSVSVLARTAAMADAAATMIGNAVDIADPAIERRPARTLKDDSDIGELLVTVAVPALAPHQVRAALQAGARRAEELLQLGLIDAALLACQGMALRVGSPPAGPTEIDGHASKAALTGASSPTAALQLGSVFA